MNTRVIAEFVWHWNCNSFDVLTTQRLGRKNRNNFRTMSAKAAQAVQAGRVNYGLYATKSDDRLNEVVCMTEDFSMENDRRGSQRFKISAPLTVVAGRQEISAFTRDLSNRGVYFFVSLQDSALIERDFEFLIEMPSEITLSSSCRIRCQGRVIRKEMTTKDLTGAGIAAEILDYSILRDAIGNGLEFAQAQDAVVYEPAFYYVDELVVAARVSGEHEETRINQIANGVIDDSFHNFAVAELEAHPDSMDDGGAGVEVEVIAY